MTAPEHTPAEQAPAANEAFLTGPMGSTYAKTALPIIFVMGMNGFLAVADALFLGWYVGPDALAAVTLMFPAYMLIVAASTLVSTGMSSVLARHLGGRRYDEAKAVFAGAHGLSLLVGGVLIGLFWFLGDQAALLAAGGSESLAEMGLIYLRILVFFAPVTFVLAVNSDALRNEGRVGFMAGMSLLVSLANIGFNYLLIGHAGMGVAGSAYGTVLAQLSALTIIIVFRMRGKTVLRPAVLLEKSLAYSWRSILALGAPQSLNFFGFGLGSAAIVAALQLVDSPSYESTVSAYGIMTRVMTFAYLPLIGLSHAMQTITGNNFGAALWRRSNQSLGFALTASLIYCAIIQLSVTLFAGPLGAAFVDDGAVISEVARILPTLSAAFFLAGPLMMVGVHFQAIGDAGRAMVLSLTKPYLFAIPLTFILSSILGESGIWITGPVAEILLLVLTGLLLAQLAQKRSLGWGLFYSVGEGR